MNLLSCWTRPPRIVLPEQLRRGTKAYDLMAALPLVVWYGVSVIAQVHLLRTQIHRLNFAHLDHILVLTILSKTAVLLFATVVIGLLFIRRPPRGGAQGILPHVAAILGTYLSVGIVLLPVADVPAWALAVSTVLILGGMTFATHSVLWLGRSFSLMAEARQLVTTGPYSVIRHPLYLGEEIAIFGVVIQYISLYSLPLLALQIGCQLYRMRCEEEVLQLSFPEYEAYKEQTVRLLPGVY